QPGALQSRDVCQPSLGDRRAARAARSRPAAGAGALSARRGAAGRRQSALVVRRALGAARRHRDCHDDALAPLRVTALTAVALWLHPALLAMLVLHVAAGEPDAPWLALGALTRPLVALLAPIRRGPGRRRPAAVIVGAVLTLLLAADFLVAADAAALLGGAPWQGVACAAVVALLVVAWPDAARAGAPALALGLIALLFPLGALPVGTATAPWTAWVHGSARAAVTFSERGVWAREGDRFALGTRVGFRDGQRVTAVAPGTFRVTEHDASQPTVREWKLGAGEALTLRPGDE